MPEISGSGISDIVEISSGGTSADNRIDAIENLVYLPDNTFPAEDTPTAWAELGSFVMYVSNAPEGISMPSTYGTLIQLLNSTSRSIACQQIWLRQGYGIQYNRSGNNIGWEGVATTSGADAWHQQIDDRGGTINEAVTINSQANIYPLTIHRHSGGEYSWIKFISVAGNETGAITVKDANKIAVMETSDTTNSYNMFDERDIIPIVNGGSGANNRVEAVKNLLVLPTNTFPADDTPQSWAAMGNFIMYCNADLSESSINLPTQYGTLIQYVGRASTSTDGSNSEVTTIQQIWLRQAYGVQYHRSGNAEGWWKGGIQNPEVATDTSEAWVREMDSATPYNLFYGGGTDTTISPGIGTLAEVQGGRISFPYTSASGFLTIHLPIDTATINSMVGFEVYIYNYTNYFVGKYTIGGETYTSNDSGWARPVASFEGVDGTALSNLPVYFCKDSDGRACVQIGSTDTAWGYGCAVIKNVHTYWNNYDADNWYTGWNLEISENLLSSNYITVETAPAMQIGTYSMYKGSSEQEPQWNYISYNIPGNTTDTFCEAWTSILTSVPAGGGTSTGTVQLPFIFDEKTCNFTFTPISVQSGTVGDVTIEAITGNSGGLTVIGGLIDEFALTSIMWRSHTALQQNNGVGLRILFSIKGMCRSAG